MPDGPRDLILGSRSGGSHGRVSLISTLLRVTRTSTPDLDRACGLLRRVVPCLAASPVLHTYTESVTDAEVTRHQHAIIKSVLAIPSTPSATPLGVPPANSVRMVLAAIAHNISARPRLSGKPMRLLAGGHPSSTSGERSDSGSEQIVGQQRNPSGYTGPRCHVPGGIPGCHAESNGGHPGEGGGWAHPPLTSVITTGKIFDGHQRPQLTVTIPKSNGYPVLDSQGRQTKSPSLHSAQPAATDARPKRSIGIGWSSRQVMAMGRSPV